MRKLERFIRDVLDPNGPIGEFFSPSDVYKTRLGLPIQAANSQRVQLETSAQVEKALAPAKFVTAAEAQPPKNRVKQVSAFIEERWTPVYETTSSTDLGEILRASQTLKGWVVKQAVRSAYCDCTRARFSKDGREYVHRECGRARKHLSNEQFVEVAQSAQLQPTDSFYVQYATTIPGKDPVILDGQVLTARDGTVITGGTQIQGRKHYNQVTKDMPHWDKGFVARREAALAEEASRPVRNVKRALEAVAGERLPMHRPVGVNLRRDRSRPV